MPDALVVFTAAEPGASVATTDRAVAEACRRERVGVFALAG